MNQQPKKMIGLTIYEITQHREFFRLAPQAPQSQTKELPLREKQAIVDEIFKGMPIAQREYYKQVGPDGITRYMVVKGWPQLRAILDFVDNKFSTWSGAERREWEQGREDRGQ